MNNYEFCAQWVLDQEHKNNIRVLDYGCGAGEIVRLLRKQDVNAFGCDVFYEGGDLSTRIAPDLLDSIIRTMEGNAIPFESGFFDFVVNNQVMEHVENIDTALGEISRVMKPGGVVLSLFPYKKVWREGHSGVPFLHWFPKGSNARVYYAAVLRVLGFGYYKKNKSVLRWSIDFCDWLDKWTCYRTQQEIYSAYAAWFCEIQHIEDYWLQQRLGALKAAVAWLPSSLQMLVVRKLSGFVFIAHKPEDYQGPQPARYKEPHR